VSVDPLAVPNPATTKWVPVAGIVGSGGGAGIPLGAVASWPWAAAQLPAGMLLPYGQLLLASAYPDLQVIADASGRPYGGAAGTNFNLPDYRGRIGVGKDDMGGTAANRITAAISGADGKLLGAVFGAEGITLTTGQLPAHNHTGTTDGENVDHSHGVNINTGTVSADHSHNVTYYRSSGNIDRTEPGKASDIDTSNTWATSGISANHYHGVVGQTAGRSAGHTHTFTTATIGSGSAHQNTQPSIVVNQFLRAA
jgi:microcystin-dependent protein